MKKLPSKVAHNQPNFFSSTALSFPYDKNLKPIWKIGLRHPLLYLLCGFTWSVPHVLSVKNKLKQEARRVLFKYATLLSISISLIDISGL